MALRAWRAIGVSDYIMNWLENGYPLEGVEALPSSFHRNSRQLQRPRENAFVRAEIQNLLSTGAIRIAPQRPKIVCSLFCVPKKTGEKLRLIWDGRPTNFGLPPVPFRYENMREVIALLQFGWYMFTIDLESGYHHAMVDPRFFPYLGFNFDGIFYEYTVLPFGLSHAPYAFTKIMRQVVKFLRGLGITVVSYVDDWFFAASTYQAAVNLRNFIVDLFRHLHLFINQKSSLEPSQRVEFLGFIIDSTTMMFEVPADKLRRLQNRLREASASIVSCRARQVQFQMSARALASIVGTLMSMALAIAPARIHTRSIYRNIDVTQRQFRWNAPAVVSFEAQEELLWWNENLARYNGRCAIRPERIFVVTTDASKVGFGGFVTTDIGDLSFQQHWTPFESLQTPAWREMTAILRALHHFRPVLQHVNLLVRSDNTNAVQYIVNGGGASRDLTLIAKEIWNFALQNCAFIDAEWIPGAQNNLADYLSRWFAPADYRLSPQSFRRIVNRFGLPDVDRMAVAATAQVARYNTANPFDRAAEALDCFTVDWSRDFNYVFPDPAVILRVVRHAQACRARMIIVVPEWPSQPWWPLLQASAISAPLHLGRGQTVCVLGPSLASLPEWLLLAFLVQF